MLKRWFTDLICSLLHRRHHEVDGFGTIRCAYCGNVMNGGR
jgi:hypothetical protein